MACLHLGEPSVRWFNRFLDRSELFGERGFLSTLDDVDDAELVGGVLIGADDPEGHPPMNSNTSCWRPSQNRAAATAGRTPPRTGRGPPSTAREGQ